MPHSTLDVASTPSTDVWVLRPLFAVFCLGMATAQNSYLFSSVNNGGICFCLPILQQVQQLFFCARPCSRPPSVRQTIPPSSEHVLHFLFGFSFGKTSFVSSGQHSTHNHPDQELAVTIWDSRCFRSTTNVSPSSRKQNILPFTSVVFFKFRLQ